MRININFTTEGFGKLFLGGKNVSDVTPNKDAIAAASDILSQIRILPTSAVEFKSIEELLGLEYVGYVIDKERYNSYSKQWIKIDEYRIIGSQTNIFRDTRIAYGYLYRYKIKSVIKITKRKPFSDLSKFSFRLDLQQSTDAEIDKSIVDNQDLLQQFKQEGNNGLDLKTSSGIPEKSIVVSDITEQILLSDNTFKTNNLISSTRSVFGSDTSQEQFTKTQNKLVENKQKVEQGFDVISVYYESNSSKKWAIIEVVNLVSPPYPQNIKIIPNSIKKEIFISWSKPVSDVEVRFYNLYRRNKVKEPWTVIQKGLKEFETLFIDKSVNFDKKYIYAISSIDFHGTESFLSTQIQTELNPNIAIEKKEKDLVWISGGGTTLDETELILKKFFERKEQLIATKNIKIKPNTKFREESKDFIVRIKSLDTHEQFELKVTLKNQKLQGNG